MAGPSEIVPLDDVSEVAPEHPAGRPLDGAVDGGIVTVDAPASGNGVGLGAGDETRYTTVGMAVVGACAAVAAELPPPLEP